MPRDDWAKARRKDISRRALRTRRYCRPLNKKSPKRKRRRRGRRPAFSQHQGDIGDMRYDCFGRHDRILAAIHEYRASKDQELGELDDEFLAITR